jgi:hypothetical protein
MVGFIIVHVAPELGGFTWFTAACGLFEIGGLSAAGIFLLYVAREAAASFVLDDDGITRFAWGFKTFLAWPDLLRLDEFNATDANFTARPA